MGSCKGTVCIMAKYGPYSSPHIEPMSIGAYQKQTGAHMSQDLDACCCRRLAVHG